MARPRKYNTDQERKEALKQYARKWYQNHKNDPEFLTAREYYYIKYRKGINNVKKNLIKSYNTEYVFYCRNVVTGKFEKKIAKTKEQAILLNKKIKEMEKRLTYLTEKFGHLTITQEESNND